jgi:hypothetical protein
VFLENLCKCIKNEKGKKEITEIKSIWRGVKSGIGLSAPFSEIAQSPLFSF